MLVNEVRIVGRIATEPTQTGKGPTHFRLGHGGGGKRKDGTPWPTQFFSVACWDTAQVEGLKKGKLVELYGKLRDNSYKAQDGTTRNAIEIVADTIVEKAWEEKPKAVVEVSDDAPPF